MSLYRLSRTILAFQNKPWSFLNGLTSNTIDKPQNAFLNIHGQIIATFDQLKINDEEIWIVVENAYIKAVLDHVDRYVRLAGVKVEHKLNYHVYFDAEGDYIAGQDEFVIPQKKGKIVLSSKNLDCQLLEEDFKLFRLRNHISVHGVDYKDELLLNVSTVDHVSFTKGCYLGQEPISKVYNRSKPTWKLVVKHEHECTQEEKAKMTSRTIDPRDNSALGFVFVKNV